MTVCLPSELHVPNTNLKINLRKVAIFSTPKSTRQPTTIHHQLTTLSPSKHHNETPLFLQPPQKNARKT
jgi:hypothetical protein